MLAPSCEETECFWQLAQGFFSRRNLRRNLERVNILDTNISIPILQEQPPTLPQSLFLLPSPIKHVVQAEKCRLGAGWSPWSWKDPVGILPMFPRCSALGKWLSHPEAWCFHLESLANSLILARVIVSPEWEIVKTLWDLQYAEHIEGSATPVSPTAKNLSHSILPPWGWRWCRLARHTAWMLRKPRREGGHGFSLIRFCFLSSHPLPISHSSVQSMPAALWVWGITSDHNAVNTFLKSWPLCWSLGCL